MRLTRTGHSVAMEPLDVIKCKSREYHKEGIMRRILSVLLINVYMLCTISCLASAQEAQPEPIRKVDKAYFQGNAPISSDDVDVLLKTSGNPDIEKMLDKGRKQKIAGGVFIAGGILLMAAGIAKDTESTGAYSALGPVYVDNGTNDGVPLVVAGVAAGVAGCILAVIGAGQKKNAISIYNEQVVGASVTLLDYRW